MPSGAYRESAAVTRVPREEIAWRRRVGVGARWLAGCLNLAVIELPQATGSDLDWFRAVVFLVVIPWTWMMTTPRPGRRRDGLAWLLLASVTGGAILSVLVLAGVTGPVPAAVVAFIALASGLEFLARLLLGIGRRRHAAYARLLIVPGAALTVASQLPLSSTAGTVVFVLGVVCAFAAYALVEVFAKHAKVITHSWWLDDGAASPGEWVSLLVHRDKHAEVISVDGQLASFKSKDDAEDWLEQHGYVRGHAAVERRLVAAQPPDVLPAKA